MNFTHLHVHTHYSVLDGMSKIGDLIAKCQKNGMNAIAITDHGNMFGIKELMDTCDKINGKVNGKIKKLEEDLKNCTDEESRASLEADLASAKQEFFKPIVGVEAYVARRSLYSKDKDFKERNAETGRERIVDSSGHHLILLAKNKKGYQNLCKIVSTSWVDGYYQRPRIDKDLLAKYSEGLIVSSACLGGEIPQLIIAGKLDEAEKSINWFKSIFGDDYYLELQRHQTQKPGANQEVYQRQREVNPHIIELARKTNTKLIATNDVHFVNEEHAEAHERLICLATGALLSDESRMRYTKQEWLKTPEEMAQIFKDIPEALSNTQEIVDKVECYSLNSPPIMPMFSIPEEFGTEEIYKQRFSEKQLLDEFTQNEKGEVVMSEAEAEKKVKVLGGYGRLYRIKLEADYLSKLAFEGAKERYGDPLPDDVHERMVFELHVMKTMGFPGYFLIVQDFIQAARDMGVSVGPGRGSAAGSVVAYCLKITDIDPLKYDLLFERFLNPDRISLPDIDIDFDDDGRAEVLRWVTQKYGKEKVAHIITYGTMATKSSIKDVARVQGVPLPEVDYLTKLIPDKFSEDKADPKTGKIPKVNLSNCLRYVPELQEARNGDNIGISDTLKYAEMLEGTVRQTGIHACGVIIGADDLTKFAPLSTATEKNTGRSLLVTQYEGSVIESVGLIKMDFLGLKTLSILKEAIKNIEKSKGFTLDISKIPIDDADTYHLYSMGQTIGTFQFESAGMQKYLRELKPSTFEDLIAMNALYRPGPMDYIPQFIARKHGTEPIVYDIPIMETYLKDTYGITVYQEQVMLLSRLLGGFTRGESDALRKAMGKKLRDKLDHMKPQFISQGSANGHDPAVLEKIWTDWEKFASYAFNKSHATCYSWISYQTAYLKAHYPAEFMAANLTRNRDDIGEVTKYMDECKAMSLAVKGPDINESELNFTVNKHGEIRFGLGGIKNVGQGAVEAIVEEREKNGNYSTIFNFVERVNLSACNKKTIENLALAGAFDCFPEISREQFFALNTKGETTLESLVRYGNRYQQDQAANTNSLFGDFTEIEITKPEIPDAAPWSSLERLGKERELIGIYLSSHPLNRYATALEYGCTHRMVDFKSIRDNGPCYFTIGGMTSGVKEGRTKRDRPYGVLTIEDYSGNGDLFLFGKDYIEYGKYLKKELFILIKGQVIERGSDSRFPKKVEANSNAPKEYEIRITSIEMLEDVYKSLLTKMTIQIDLSDLDSMFVNDLVPILSAHPGTCELNIVVTDSSMRAPLNMRSRQVYVNIDKYLIDELHSLQKSYPFTYKIN